MSWTPESTLPLAEDIDVAAVEQSSMRLWHEFLAGYFDGASHFGLPYPQASLSFQNAAIPQPLDGLNLHIVAVSGGKPRIFPMPQGFTAYQRMTWTFYLRASVENARPDGQNTESLARWGADALYHLLMSDGQLFPLHRAGILQIRPGSPKLAPSMDYSVRSIDCAATLAFVTRPVPVLAANGDTLLV